MEVSGARSSWLTMPRNSVRVRSISSNGARSCRVTTTDSTSPAAERIGVALISVVTRRPSGDRQHDLFGAHGLGAAQLLRQRELGEGNLVTICTLADDHFQQLLWGAAWQAQGIDDSTGLLIDRNHRARSRLEDRDANG